MHYFKRNLGDYYKKAGRLSMLEHGAYTLLQDACYDREQFPTMEEAIEWTWASSAEEVAAVEFVLRKFFKLVDGVYVQSRIQEEIDKYHKNALTNKRIAVDRENKKRTERERVEHEPCTDEHEPPPNHRTNNQITTKPNNQEPVKKTRSRFTPPAQQDVFEYMQERGIANAWDQSQKFIDHYTSNGWKVGKNSMKDWKATVRNWQTRIKDYGPKQTSNSKGDLFSAMQTFGDTGQRDERVIHGHRVDIPGMAHGLPNGGTDHQGYDTVETGSATERFLEHSADPVWPSSHEE